MDHALRVGFGTGVLAEEVVFLRGGKRRVAVRRADHAELVGVGAEPLLDFQSPL